MNCREMLKLPWKLIRKFKLSRVKNIGMYLRTEGISGTQKRLMECLYGTEIYRQKLILKKVKPIKSLNDCKLLQFPQISNPLVTVIIPVYNEFAFTYQCLCSLLEAGDESPFEVILADDCSTDLTTDICQIVKNINVVKTEKNLGFLMNCNNAAKQARGKYIYFLNNDTQVQTGWLDAQVNLLEDHEDIGMTGAKLVYPDGRLMEAGGIVWCDGTAANYGNRQDPILPEFNYVKEVDYISGAAIMIRKKIWEEIGGFDTRYCPAYCEDSDLAFAVREAGYKVIYQPESVVIHFEGISNGIDAESAGMKSYQKENQKKLYAKWKGVFEKQLKPNENIFHARERSNGKKIIVMFDHTIPSYDQDAGSRTEYQYIRLFLKKGFIVKFIPNNFHYTLPYVKELQRMGVEVLYGENSKKNIFIWLEEHREDIDYVILNRPDLAGYYIDFFRNQTSSKIIYYGHDFHYMRNLREYELTGKEEMKQKAEEWLRTELDIMRKATVSFFPSELEVEKIKELDGQLAVKALTGYVYEKEAEKGKDYSEREGLFFVGGFRHPPNQDGILWFVNEIFPIIREKLQVSLYIAGSNQTKEITELGKKPGVRVLGQISDEALREMYEKCRVIVVPLRYGAGVKGKVIEAMYYGVPIVTTPIGLEGIPDAEGIPAESDSEAFAEKVIELYQNEASYNQIRQQEREIIRRHYLEEAVWDRIKEDFYCE